MAAAHNNFSVFFVRSLAVLLYGTVACLAFLMTVVQTGRFVYFVTKLEINSELAALKQLNNEDLEDWISKLILDALLVLMFVVQHSVMATVQWKKLVHFLQLGVIERSIFVMGTSVSLELLMTYWKQPAAVNVWMIDLSERPMLWFAFTFFHALLWILIFGATLMMDLSELFGLKQVYYYSLDMKMPLALKSEGLQRLYWGMRHPGSICLSLILWVHPMMTASRLLLAILFTFYMLSRFQLDNQDYCYLKDNLVRKRDELSHLNSENQRLERQTMRTSLWCTYSTGYHSD